MSYRYQPTGTHPVAVPFTLKASVSIDENKGQTSFFCTHMNAVLLTTIEGTFDITLSSRLTTRTFEKIAVEWYLGDGASGVSCNASNASSWTFDARSRVR
jgi:AP-3 complex subunit mu